MKRRTKRAIGLLMLMFVISLTGCKKEEQIAEGEKEYQIYYLNKNETKMTSVSYFSKEEDYQALVDELFQQLEKTPDDPELCTTISASMELGKYEVSEGRLNVDFGQGYMNQKATTEVLVRAAIVRTLCQVDEIDCVTFTINQDALLNQSGLPVGVMSDELFVENTGNEINAYEKVLLTLYFADASGKGLKKIQREEVYNSNISIEKLVVDKIINGPLSDENGAYPTLSPETKVLSVSVKDGVCYVNFDSAFLTRDNGVNAEVTIYSLVNSLIELNNVNKVQISIDGDTDVSYKESVSLKKPLERKFELVEE